ncbi:MAG: type II secretion system protein [Fimbriimonadales bacterium]
MRKRAFTLIELLVVVAIIAILSAILFPVFARAKETAKKTASIATMKQLAGAVMMYASDYNDIYPRQDGCQPYSSINPHLNGDNLFSGDGCTAPGPYPWRLNHYSWQKWIYPYMNTFKPFFHPRWVENEESWETNGELLNGYAINLSLTGALNRLGGTNRDGAYRNSFLGGMQTAIPDPSSAMLFMEFVSSDINFAPVLATPRSPQATAYPLAIREIWEPVFMKWRSTSDCTTDDRIDMNLVSFGEGINLCRADGSAKWYHIRKFLDETPPASEYRVSPFPNAWRCGPNSGLQFINSPPVWTRPWPLWGLG